MLTKLLRLLSGGRVGEGIKNKMRFDLLMWVNRNSLDDLGKEPSSFIVIIKVATLSNSFGLSH